MPGTETDTCSLELLDACKTILLCVQLISSFLRRTDQDHSDPYLLNANPACTRWLTLHPTFKTAAEKPPHSSDAGAAETVTIAPARSRKPLAPFPVRGAPPNHAPGSHSEGGEREPYGREGHESDGSHGSEFDGSDEEDSDGSDVDDYDESSGYDSDGSNGHDSDGSGGHDVHGSDGNVAKSWSNTAGADLLTGSLVCRALEPAASEVLWEWIVVTCGEMFVKLAFASFCSSFRLGSGKERARAIRFLELRCQRLCIPPYQYKPFFLTLHGLRGLKLTSTNNSRGAVLINKILPGLNISSPLLTVLDIEGFDDYWREFITVNAADVASSIAILKLLRLPLPLLTCKRPNPHLALGPSLGPAKSLRRSDPRFAASSLKAHTSLESEAILATLLAACPTIQDLDLGECQAITNATLAVLEKHPPLHCLDLHCLDLRFQPHIIAPAIVSFLRACGSRLRYLAVPTLDVANSTVFAAIASHAPNRAYITRCRRDSGTPYPSFTWESIQFVKDLAVACPLLKTFNWAADDLALNPDRGRIEAFMDGLRIDHRWGLLNPFFDSLNDPTRFAGVTSC
ncbi:hypothetical protein BDK51DRAFT_46766 [Blyttiomyces helicus]|uniref:Uncharacterized protein n=1 Tax=Blyttiomyces helicus TaxID=388810 RepID=A0A4P9WHW4_9FUNG|nr:hypothetical protein BDK51DRAFT_46766 [Blyttiomyces helicus]|eukprot:RKO90136.1 hypothetical protein BDK51DRAFT_46766 [Blyttiomyces helicus]